MIRRFTAYCKFPSGEIEEIDVDAQSASAARALARAQLDSNYEPGGKIIRVVERFGLYL